MSEPFADEALYAKGLAVLEEHLGPVDALRFLRASVGSLSITNDGASGTLAL